LRVEGVLRQREERHEARLVATAVHADRVRVRVGVGVGVGVRVRDGLRDGVREQHLMIAMSL